MCISVFLSVCLFSLFSVCLSVCLSIGLFSIFFLSVRKHAYGHSIQKYHISKFPAKKNVNEMTCHNARHILLQPLSSKLFSYPKLFWSNIKAHLHTAIATRLRHDSTVAAISLRIFLWTCLPWWPWVFWNSARGSKWKLSSMDWRSYQKGTHALTHPDMCTWTDQIRAQIRGGTTTSRAQVRVCVWTWNAIG